MVHRVEGSVGLVGSSRSLSHSSIADHLKITLRTPFVVMHPFSELARADEVANSLFSIWDQQSKLLDRKIFARAG
jgi:hypothetical protein